MANKPRGGAASSSRVPRNTLSRDRIVEAALALLDAQGSEAVTMPSLARRLGVGTMSLYRHVEDKDDLINAVAERVLSTVQVPRGDLPAAAYTAAWNDAVDHLDPAAYPTLHALREQLTTAASSDQFEYGLEQLTRSLHPPS